MKILALQSFTGVFLIFRLENKVPNPTFEPRNYFLLDMTHASIKGFRLELSIFFYQQTAALNVLWALCSLEMHQH